VLLAPRVFPAEQLAAARERLAAKSTTAGHEHGMGDVAEQGALPLRERLKSRSGWVAAASYAISDLKMLRRELVIGYLVAGILAIAVPASVYSAVFMQGHGFWTDLENVVVGPFIAVVSFVCSIGNVPLAAALFHGGFSFGGTIAFIFADLITLPLVLIYAKFYGWKLTLRLFFAFWAVMSAAGLAVDYLFRWLAIPSPQRPAQITPMRFEWNYTTFLNIVFLIIGVIVYVAHRNRDRFTTSSAQYAIDPVCGMQVERVHAPAIAQVEGSTFYFCSDRCQERFIAERVSSTR
jgi:YHS domain-containing protein